MIGNEVPEKVIESQKVDVEQENQAYTNVVLEEYPMLFNELILRDGSRGAMLYNNPISEDMGEASPFYKYIALTKYGLTKFNSSFDGFLGWEITTKAISLLVELSKGREVTNLSVSEFKRWGRNRINKGLIPLKAILRTVTITGVHLTYGVKDFYENILPFMIV